MKATLPPLHAWSSALIAALVGFGGTIAVVVQALRTLGSSVEHTVSAVTALCLGIAVAGAALSLKTRMPIVLAWSTPGAALMAATTPGLSWSVAVGSFIFAALLTIVLGLVPALTRLAARIPGSIASAMLAGVLLPFCLDVFRLGAADPLLVFLLVGMFIVARRRAPLYALLMVLVVGFALTLLRGDVTAVPSGAIFGDLVPTVPTFGLRATLSLALPLFLVTLMSQTLPGLMVLRSAGYQPPTGPLLVGTGIATLFTAPFGSLAINLAAITAAICAGDEAHPHREKRWHVALIYAGFYLLLAFFAPTLVRLFLALPPAMIATLTGVALIPALVSSVENMLATRDERDAAILTFLATGSGIAVYELESAFAGLLVGFFALGAKALWRQPQGNDDRR